MAKTDPLLIDLPEQVLTQRLLMRFPRPGDGPVLNAALVESIDELKPWMVWIQAVPPLAESEAYCRRMVAKVALREDLPLFIFERGADRGEGRLVGATGLHRIDWDVPRFEAGYWRRSGCGGQGFIAEAVGGLVAMAFESLAARRVEIRCDANNAASRRVAERNGFTLEGILRNESLTPAGEIRSTCVYAKLSGG
jgi:ribosomal-protein-serine acetyltransferase